MSTSLVIKNGSVLPCTPVSLSVSCDPGRKTNYALILPPQELVFNRNGSEAMSDFIISIDLPLWMGCVKLHPNFDTTNTLGSITIRFSDIKPDGSSGASCEATFHPTLDITDYAASLTLTPVSGVVPFTGVSDEFVGCKFVAVLTQPIQLTAEYGFELCEPITKSADEVCGRGAVCATNAPDILIAPDPVNLGDFGLTQDFPIDIPAPTSYKWTIFDANDVDQTSTYIVDDTLPNPTASFGILATDADFTINVTVAHDITTVFTLSKPFHYSPSV